MSGFDDDNDGGLREQAETEQERAEYWGRRDSAALEAHRKWKREFESGLPTMKPKNSINETNYTEKTI